MRKLFFILFAIGCVAQCFSQEAERKVAYDNYIKYFVQARQVNHAKKENSIQQYRENFHKTPYRPNSFTMPGQMSGSEYFSLLTNNGQFADLMQQEAKIMDERMLTSKYTPQSNAVAALVQEAFNRIWKIAENVRHGEMKEDNVLVDKYLKAIIRYGNIETGRSNAQPRFHASCFAIPTAAVNIYFAFLKQMDEAEAGNPGNPLLKDACVMLKEVALQCWTQPFRNDSTDKNVVSIERFRNHVWWVGGNALGYRPLFPVACMYKSVPMLNLLAEVSSKSISKTSQATYRSSFWNEGFTADGAGWGHGKQCLVWGYPIDGTNGALRLLAYFKGTPWEKTFTTENKESLLNYFRGANWYYYKGYVLPCLDRNSMSYNVASRSIPYQNLLNSVIKDWSECFSETELKELIQLQAECEEKNVRMSGYPEGMYNGTRWFYNNDDLIKKNDRYHLIINMASIRCDGLESADFADRYNFAASATSGGAHSATGFIFEKINDSDKENVNDRGDNQGKNPVLYGVKAYKSYFIIDDYMIALGAGVTNLQPGLPGTIRTTIDQTALDEKITLIENGVEKPVPPGGGSFYSKQNTIWVKQENKFAYTVLPDFSANAYYACETKKTDWVKMNPTNKEKEGLPEEVHILRLWIDHGTKPVNDTYGYAVYMGDGKPDIQLPATVLKNDTTLQAVQSADEKITGAVFYNSKVSLQAKGFKVSVSAPCAVLFEKAGNNNYLVTVTDAEMNNSLDKITLLLNGKAVVFTVPKGKDCGKPIVKKIIIENIK